MYRTVEKEEYKLYYFGQKYLNICGQKKNGGIFIFHVRDSKKFRALQSQLSVRRNFIFFLIFFSQVESEIQVESSLYFGSGIPVESSLYFGSGIPDESSLYFGNGIQVESSQYFGSGIQVETSLHFW